MADQQALIEAGRRHLHLGEWPAARDQLRAALELGENADALAHLAMACWWLNDVEESMALQHRAHTIFKREGRLGPAAFSAAWIAVQYFGFQENQAAAEGWLAVGQSLLEEAGPCPEMARLMVIGTAVLSDLRVAKATIEQGAAMAKSFGDRDCELLAQAYLGLVRVSMGELREGLKLLDEALALCSAGEVEELWVVGLVYCAMLAACERVSDFARAEQWCSVGGFVEKYRNCLFSATCRACYGGVLAARGHWEAAEHELLGDLLEKQAANFTPRAAEIGGAAAAQKAPAAGSAAATVAESTLRVDAARIDAVMNLVGELIIGKSMLHRSLAELDQRHARDPVRAKLSDALAFQSRVLDELHKCVLKIRMVPVEQLFRRFPRLVRDVAKQCGKDVALELSGQNTDLDKGILDALAEPLMHIVRNAVDHGVEDAEERIAANKPARGTVYLNAYHQGTQVVIEVRDDGRGVDLTQIRRLAVEKGIVRAEEIQRLSDSDAMNLIFEPGFSTAAEITEVSGRGVGMDVVRTVLDNLKGTVHVSSVKGRGTTIQLRVPLTLASIQTLLFRVAGRLFAVPLSSVVEITRITDGEIHRVDQREVLRLREQILTLVRLNSLSQIHAVAAQDGQKKKRSFVIVIGAAEKRFGLVVDSLVGEEELVIKALPGEIISSDLVSGASILGDGTVVLILNVPAVLSRLSRATPLGAIA